jgi:mannose-6-phosphate isomerase
MVGICPLRNPIREYAWGSRSAIAELLGQGVPADRPQAELWMGAHPSDSSQARCGDRWISLLELLREDPTGVLGGEVAARFDGRLPFLFKVLAANQPLSLQAHPDREQAIDGFARENAEGIAVDAPERNYRDPYAKPELICALTPFRALTGFRTVSAIIDGFRALGADVLDSEIRALEDAPNAAGLEKFFAAVLAAPRDQLALALAQVSNAAAFRDRAEAQWIATLAARFPGDPAALAPLLLNLIEMAPGEAMYLAPGGIHSYLEGVGIEIMANSDNVLRGGLSEKRVDVSELRRVLRFEPSVETLLQGRELSASERVFETPAKEFELSVLAIEEGVPWQSQASRGVEILLSVEGAMQVEDCDGGESFSLERGGSVLIPDSVVGYRLVGRGVAYRASIPRGCE